MCVKSSIPAIKAYLSTRPLGMAFTASADDWQEASKLALERGKRVSDFVGMITRAAFCLLGALYIIDRAHKEPGIFAPYAMGCTATILLALYVYLTIMIYIIVLIYFMKDTAIWKSAWLKIPQILLSLVFAGSFIYGEVLLVSELAKRATLP
jgi:hypothetical protein